MGLGPELLGHLQHVGDLGCGIAVISHSHGLVVDPSIQIALEGQKLHDITGSPTGPMMGGEQQLGGVTKHLQHLIDVLRPRQRITSLGTADWDQVVHVVGAIFGSAEPLVIREIEIHLGRSLRIRGQLEHDPDPIHH